MSRRSRRRTGRPPAKGVWLLKGVGAVLVLVLFGMAGAWMWLRSWLHSEDFRRMLSTEAGRALGAEASFGRFQWDGTEVETLSFDAESAGLVERVSAEGLKIDIGLGKVRERIVELRNAEIRRIDVTLDLRGEASEPVASPTPEPAGPEPGQGEGSWYDRFVPNEIRLTGLDIGNSALGLRLDEGEVAFQGTRWTVEPEAVRGSYLVEARGGRVEFPWDFLPALELSEAHLRYKDRSVYLTDSRFGLYSRGDLRLTGEASLAGEGLAFDGELRDVDAGEVLPEDWKQRVEGGIESDFAIANRAGSLSVGGRLHLLRGVLTGLPVLDHLGAYGGNPRFRRLALSEASLDFRWEDGTLTLSDIRIGSEGLMRVEGRLRVDAQENLDGRFRVGLTPGTLASIPGAETKVFLPGERGLLWTDLRITGTVEDPEEDLSARLIEAAGLRMFEILPETGERVLKFTRQVISEDLLTRLEAGKGVVAQGTRLLQQTGAVAGEIVRQGGDVIRQGEQVVDGVKGLIDDPGGLLEVGGGLLGGGLPGLGDRSAKRDTRAIWIANLQAAKTLAVDLRLKPVDRLEELEGYDTLRFRSYAEGREDWVHRRDGLGKVDGKTALFVSPEALDGRSIVGFDDGSARGVDAVDAAALLQAGAGEPARDGAAGD